MNLRIKVDALELFSPAQPDVFGDQLAPPPPW